MCIYMYICLYELTFEREGGRGKTKHKTCGSDDSEIKIKSCEFQPMCQKLTHFLVQKLLTSKKMGLLGPILHTRCNVFVFFWGPNPSHSTMQVFSQWTKKVSEIDKQIINFQSFWVASYNIGAWKLLGSQLLHWSLEAFGQIATTLELGSFRVASYYIGAWKLLGSYIEAWKATRSAQQQQQQEDEGENHLS